MQETLKGSVKNITKKLNLEVCSWKVSEWRSPSSGPKHVLGAAAAEGWGSECFIGDLGNRV